MIVYLFVKTFFTDRLGVDDPKGAVHDGFIAAAATKARHVVLVPQSDHRLVYDGLAALVARRAELGLETLQTVRLSLPLVEALVRERRRAAGTGEVLLVPRPA